MRGEAARLPVITIDGPAGAGKSTVARALAARLGFRLLDTGAMYRAVAWSVAAAGLDPADGAALRTHLASLDLEVRDGRMWVNGRDVTSEIRTPAVAELTSRISMLAAVRERVTPLQRRVAAQGGVVLQGRDTGTVVCPDADVKFYLDAALEQRAQRRHAELLALGIDTPLETVRRELRTRDAQDTGRALAPLRKAVDAITVDTTHLSVAEAVAQMARVVEQRCCTRL